MLIRPQSRTDLLECDELPGLVLVLDQGCELRPVRGQPVHPIRLIDDAVERIPGGVLERLVAQPGGGILDQLMQPLVARPCLKGVGNPDAGPVLRGKVQEALRIGFAKSWRRVELEHHGIVGRMA